MTMRMSDVAIEAAFKCHAKHYGVERLWMVPYHMECWIKARDAFDNGSEAAFNWLYDELRKKWQVFRSKNYEAPTPERVRQILNAMPPALRNRRLTDFAQPTPAILDECWDALTRASDIKRNVDGPSLVAVTKFLHFWNPRLFVIADREVVWDWVFEHGWLWEQVEDVRREIDLILSDAVRSHQDFTTELMDYLAVLVWGGRVLQANPGICRAFANYVEHISEDPVELNLIEYEGAALEWFLLGLVEMPPAGLIME